ncbi:MAG: hypothetical protein GXO77_06220 [Calditrichaeota bacterium]|nr:hypothetical protein [Calditrichota bacterium]
MSKKRILYIVLFLTIFINLAQAQTAEGFFHLSANLYIRGQLEQAIQTVQKGLQLFPNDPYLNALSEKLKKKKQQQQQQQQNQQQQQKQQEQKKQTANEGKKNKKDEQQKQQKAQKKGEKKKEMTKKEAERILRALKEENKKFKKEHLRIPASRRQLEKDW